MTPEFFHALTQVQVATETAVPVSSRYKWSIRILTSPFALLVLIGRLIGTPIVWLVDIIYEAWE